MSIYKNEWIYVLHHESFKTSLIVNIWKRFYYTVNLWIPLSSHKYASLPILIQYLALCVPAARHIFIPTLTLPAIHPQWPWLVFKSLKYFQGADTKSVLKVITLYVSKLKMINIFWEVLTEGKNSLVERSHL